MMQQAPVRAYKTKPMSREMRNKVERSYHESMDLKERALHCPHCGRYLAALFSDASGHFKVKCNNCKTITIFNMGYFRRMKRNRYPR